VRVGLGLPQLGPHVTADCVREFVLRAEELGFSSLWVQEHLFYPHQNQSTYGGRYTRTVHEAYRSVFAPTELLGFVAGISSTIMLGTSVLVAGYHRPVELAQRLASLDVLSKGRLIVGMGAGWSEEEHDQMDVEPRTRGRRMTELVEALTVCWGPDPVSFDGEFFSIPHADIRPKPLQSPRPALMSGLRSPKGLIRTAEQFDIWNPLIGTGVDIVSSMQVMNERRGASKPLRLIVRSYVARPSATADEIPPGLDGVRADVAEAIKLGAEEIIVEFGFWSEVTSPERWVEIPERFAVLLDDAERG